MNKKEILCKGAQLAKEAVKVLDEVGWCQGTLENRDKEVCLLGSVYKARCGHARNGWETHAITMATDPAFREVWSKLMAACHDPVAWNDQHGRTKSEVRDLLVKVGNELRREAIEEEP